MSEDVKLCVCRFPDQDEGIEVGLVSRTVALSGPRDRMKYPLSIHWTIDTGS